MPDWCHGRVPNKANIAAKLAPESVGLTLVRAGCFLSAYELIKSEVVGNVHEFYLSGLDQGKLQYDEVRYQSEVRQLDPKSVFRASCTWLVQRDALTAEQVGILEEIRQHRNQIPHELPNLLINPDMDVRVDLLLSAIECVRTLGIFWASIEVATDPIWVDRDIDYEGIKSGSYLLLEYLASIAGLDDNTDQ